MNTVGERARARRAGVVAAILALVATQAACAQTPVAAPTSTSAAPAYVSTWVEPAATQLAPLRGTVVAAGSLNHASIAAKIDNHEEARPQIGLERTDIVFEEMVEGGLTRYLAIWQSDVPDQIGPIRSIRPMDPDIVSSFGGIICYSGGQQRFVAMMQATNVYNAIHGQAATAATIYRIKTKDAPHNVVVDANVLLSQHTDIAPPQQQFAYASGPTTASAAKEGSPTAALNLRFSAQRYPSWTWDAASGKWLRNQEGHPDPDTNGAQLSATNVVVLRVGVTVSQSIPKTELIGAGEAFVSTGGGTIHATWHKDSPTGVIRLIDDYGVTVRLAAGNTWIELVPNSGSVELVPPAA